MKKSHNMNVTEETKHTCEFCKKEFVRERTLFTHTCTIKNRWLSKDLPGNRIGFQAYVQFYKKNSAKKNLKTYEEFIRDPFYSAFTKFGIYCVDIKCVNITRYNDWLLKNNIKIDNWATDTNYTKFLCEYLLVEDPLDAIHRSIEHIIEKATNESVLTKDYLRYGNTNVISNEIAKGKISPWLLYCSNSGVKFIESLRSDQQKMIMDYIDPEKWALKFHREPDITKQVKEILYAGGY